ncbi:insulinase family protein [Acinetobacter apis]|uniref:Zinc protease n=1 Tax=Acinetobacter apis TaxID=1229165 RepID=A0A217EDT2_9GAMM|nr:insulinase family protein [Acinetobacter apis]SNQ28412.1 zinc protease [Acinetobacter apis]
MMRYVVCFIYLFYVQMAVGRAAEVMSAYQPAHQGQLSNGVRYTLIPLAGQGNRIDVRMIVQAGALHQTEQQSGVAHMVEHMVFYRSEHYPQGLAKYLQSEGWERGKNYNAMTNAERTLFMLSPPKGKLELARSLNTLAEIAQNSRFNAEDLKQERLVILEEWRGKLGVAERMNDQRMKALRLGSLYPQRSVTGNENTIQTMPLNELKQFYDTWYQPQHIQLLIMGDIDVNAVKQQIEQQFGQLKQTSTPKPISADVALQNQLRVVRLKDSESGSSQISFVYRFNDVLAKQADTEAGLKQRLMHQIALEALTIQLKHQQQVLPDFAHRIVVRKSEIGAHQFALAFFADVTPGQQEQALPILLAEIVKLQQNQISDEIIQQVKKDIQLTATKMAQTKEQREFSDWVRKIVPSWQQNQLYRGSAFIGQQVLTVLPQISTSDIHQTIHDWLTQTDQLVQYSMPGHEEIDFPQPQAIQNTLKRLTEQRLKLASPRIDAVAKLNVPSGQGKILAQVQRAHGITEFELSNGDRLIWLTTPLAKNQMYFTSKSSAGFNRTDLNSWQAQIASQWIAQSGPHQWQNTQYVQWKKQHKVTMSIDHQPNFMQFSAQASATQFKDLLQLYAALQQPYSFDQAQLQPTLAEMIRIKVMEQQSVSGLRRSDIQQLRFGTRLREPTSEQLQTLNAQQLDKVWDHIRKTPTIYYVLSAESPLAFEHDIERYLAAPTRDISRKQLNFNSIIQQTGRLEKMADINLEPRAEIRAWSIHPVTWSPQQALNVSIAKTLAEKKLRYQLRDQMQGIYRMTFNSELDDQKNAVYTDVSFTASPERAIALWQETQNVLLSFANQLTADDVAQEVQKRVAAAQLKNKDILTLQKRLMLSYQHYNDARYLQQASEIYKKIALSDIQQAAQYLYDPNYTALYITFPQKSAVTPLPKAND